MQGGTIKVYTQRNVIDQDFSTGENYISEDKFLSLVSFQTYPGDLLVTTRGTIGRAALLPADAETGILHPCLLRVQPDPERLDPRYLWRLVQDSHLLRAQLQLMSNATTIEVIYSETIATLLLPIPPRSEQLQHIRFLDQETAKADELISTAEATIILLHERRTALISAAVTGKIDVRHLAATPEPA